MTSELLVQAAKRMQLYQSTPAPCPYLTDRLERRILVDLSDGDAWTLYEQLSLAGFRRSLGYAYRPVCPGCNACVPVRICVRDFVAGRAWRRVLANNADLTVQAVPMRATPEQFALFRRYQNGRHGDGDMARMDERDFRAMAELGALDSQVVEARDDSGQLMAACFIDRLASGLSAVYSFFDPDQPRRSLGNFLILQLIEIARAARLPHVYLGYWIADSRKMAYKSRFQPLEALIGNEWRRRPPPADEGRGG